MKNEILEKALIRDLSVVFKALGSPVRLPMLLKLSDGECCVCELVELVGLGFPTVSRHLSVLKAAGLVEDDKRGQQVFYRLTMPCVIQFCECLVAVKRGEAADSCSAM